MSLPINCLHGAIGSSPQFQRLLTKLSTVFLSVHLFDFVGHGGKPLPEQPFSIELFVGDRDTMVSISEKLHVYRLMKNGSFAALTSTPHPIEQMNVDLLTEVFQQFILRTR